MAPKTDLLTAPIVTRAKTLSEFNKAELLEEAYARNLWVNDRWSTVELRSAIQEDRKNPSADHPGNATKGMHAMSLEQLKQRAMELNYHVPPFATRGTIMRILRDQGGMGPESVLGFGRFRGKMYKDTPIGYRTWALREVENNDNPSEDLVMFANWWQGELHKWQGKPPEKASPDPYDAEENATIPYVDQASSTASWDVLHREALAIPTPKAKSKAPGYAAQAPKTPTRRRAAEGGEIFGGAPRIAQEPARDSPATVMGTHHDGEDYNNYFHICEEANNDEGNPSCDDDDKDGGSYDEFLFHLDSEVTKEIYETEYKPDVNMKWLTQGIVPVESKDAERHAKLLALSNTEQRARKGLVDAERIWEGHLQPVTTPAPPSARLSGVVQLGGVRPVLRDDVLARVRTGSVLRSTPNVQTCRLWQEALDTLCSMAATLRRLAMAVICGAALRPVLQRALSRVAALVLFWLRARSSQTLWRLSGVPWQEEAAREPLAWLQAPCSQCEAWGERWQRLHAALHHIAKPPGSREPDRCCSATGHAAIAVRWFSLGMVLAAVLPKTLRDRLNLHRKVPRIEALVVLVVTVLSKQTNIAVAVLVGVSICAISFAWDAGHDFHLTESLMGNMKVYEVDGPLFFTSANRLVKLLDPSRDPEEVELHFGEATLMDFTSVEILHKVALNYKSAGKNITFHTLNLSSQKIIEKANHLVKAIEYTASDAAVRLPSLPSFTDGFRADPMAAEGVFERIVSGGSPDSEGRVGGLSRGELHLKAMLHNETSKSLNSESLCPAASLNKTRPDGHKLTESEAPRNGTPTRPTDATHVAQQIQDADAKVRGQALKIQELRGQLHRARSGLPFNDLPRVSYGQESVQRSQSLLAETKKARDLNESLKAEIGAVKLNLDKVAEEANGKIDAANERIRSLRRERDDALKEGDRLRAEGERLMSRQEAVRKETEDLVQQKELLLTVVEELHRTCNNAGIKEVARHSIKDIGEFTANFRLT
ncbi:hypothetical protein AK812_SmicGene35850 [Symbiodinium microadriaticum]|uniref:STAS domain-containing protein n=1 Tax=Symbiodinium microadriaticum TaxID=2951 RepID=A0A1Q9CKF9_SYMMI|nr:hypothetical protein AK812_SmicGene35850 [Symbiodinium microadriaticum]